MRERKGKERELKDEAMFWLLLILFLPLVSKEVLMRNSVMQRKGMFDPVILHTH